MGSETACGNHSHLPFQNPRPDLFSEANGGMRSFVGQVTLLLRQPPARIVGQNTTISKFSTIMTWCLIFTLIGPMRASSLPVHSKPVGVGVWTILLLTLSLTLESDHRVSVTSIVKQRLDVTSQVKVSDFYHSQVDKINHNREMIDDR